MERFIVERIEDGVAVLEKQDMTHSELTLSVLPAEIGEGSVLLFDGMNYFIDHEDENERRKRIFEKQKNLIKKAKKL